MGSIFAPTDFSSAALNANHYAIGFCKTYKLPMVLGHVFKQPLLVTDVPFPESEEYHWEKTKEEFSRFSVELEHVAGEEIKIEPLLFKSEDGHGMTKVLHKKEVSLCVLGYHERSELGKLLLGNGIQKILINDELPILWVKPGMHFKPVNKYMVAIDFERIPKNRSMGSFWKIVNLLQAEMHVVMIDRGRTDLKKTLPLIENLKSRGATIHFLPGDDLVEEVGNFCSKNNMDLQVVFPHRHTMAENWLYGSLSKSILSAARVPVICISE